MIVHRKISTLMLLGLSFLVLAMNSFAQPEQTPNGNDKTEKKKKERARTVTIPITFRNKDGKQETREELIQAGELTVKENGESKTILSLRNVESAPLSLAVLIQDDSSSNVSLELKGLADFIRRLPNGSRVFVGYLRAGSLQVRQKFTDDLEKAANSLRIPVGTSSVAPGNPYEEVLDALKKFESQPSGRRAVLLVSDGLDTSRGISDSTPGQSIDLDRAITKAQTESVAVYSFYSSATLTENGSSLLVSNGQGSLERLSDETGGRAYFQGTSSPVSFDPFFRDLNLKLTRQFALTYLTTAMKKGFYKVEVLSGNPTVKIEHPKGYFYK